MTQVWLYSVRASSDPDHVCCVVPWRVDKALIFFGPCKKRMRERLRRQFLRADRSHATVPDDNFPDDIYIVGVNGSNDRQCRKVVWAGRLCEVMTFQEADRRLRGDRFDRLRGHSCSPLHVCPMVKNGELVGYEHVSDEHKKDLHKKDLYIKDGEWVLDVVSNPAKPSVKIEGRKLILKQGTAWQAFDRDCCMLLANRFFAQGQGIEIDEEVLEILRQAQRKKTRTAKLTGGDHFLGGFSAPGLVTASSPAAGEQPLQSALPS